MESSVSGSEDPEPSRVTIVPSETVCVGPASASGDRLTLLTLTMHAKAPWRPSSSVTVSSNFSGAPLAPTFGDVNVGFEVESSVGLIERIEDEAVRIEEVLVQGQSMSKALCDRVNVDDVRVPLVNILANAQIKVQERSRECNVPVCVVRVPEHAYVACDPEGLSLAVSHLLDNAVRFSPAGSTVTLEADVHSDGMLTITINDDGEGMEPDFFAAHLNPSDDLTVEIQSDGNGVGLPLVKAIAEAHGGVLEIRSMPNQGTTAMLVIPADRVQLESEFAA